MFRKLFGSTRGALTSDALIAKNQKAEQQLLHRRAQLQNEVETLLLQAQSLLRQGDKQGAGVALRRRRRAQQRLQYVESQLDVVLAQLQGLEDVEMHREVAQVSKATTKMLNPANLTKEADEAADTLSMVDEIISAVEELGEACGGTYVPPFDVSEELESLEAELADNLPTIVTQPQIPTGPPIPRQQTPPEKNEPKLKTTNQVLEFALS